MLKKIAQTLYVSPSDQTAFGLDIGTRTTVIDLDGQGSLFVHSPVPQIAEELKLLGTVKYVVLPNKWRKNSSAEFRALFPEAQWFGAPELEKVVKKLVFETIRDDQFYPWSEQIEHRLIQGSPFFNEVAFFHKPSKTLMLADHAGFMYDGGPLTAQLGLKLLKAKTNKGWTAPEKKLYIRDHKAFAASIGKILDWNFTRVLIAHGSWIETTTPSAFRERLL